MTAKILVPVDFSPVTKPVLAWATSLARDRKASLILLHVQEPVTDALGGEMYIPMPLAEDPNVRQALMDIKPDDASIPCEHKHLLGPASHLIVKVASDEHVDLIVMGSHGRGWLRRLLLGSVAQHVMRHAPCPVMIVKTQCGDPDDAHRAEADRLEPHPA